MKNLSDVHDHSFGQHYGVLIQGLPIPLLARAVFVVDPSNTITYAEIVPEIAQSRTTSRPSRRLRAAAGGLIADPHGRQRRRARAGGCVRVS